MCGDFNLHVQNQNDRHSTQFLEIIQVNNLQQLTDIPSHKRGGTLDLIINDINSIFPVEDLHVDESFDVSDHYPVMFEVPCELHKTEAVTKTQVRELHNFDLDHFHSELESSGVCNPMIFSQMSFESETELYYNITLESLFNKHCPVKDKTYRSQHVKSKWYNRRLQLMKQNKRLAVKITTNFSEK